jgi:2-polyprenyl-3-methyl-5-hydroxy-6-metoxy-1,4-benzoquinol methylase
MGAQANATMAEIMQQKDKMNSTLNFYNTHAKSYISETENMNVDEVTTLFLSLITAQSHILDLGCGSGRDSLFFKHKGHKITAVDGSRQIAQIASERLQQTVLLQDFNHLTLLDRYEAIWACASLLHCKLANLPLILNNLKKHLKRKGIFYASFKYAPTSYEAKDENGRFFSYLSTHDAERLFTRDFSLIKCWTQTKPLRNIEQTWLNILVKNDD